jgi:transcriptional regulator with XRE-family HTH domain
MSTVTQLPVWTLGERMAKARESAGLSRLEMADELRVTERTIRNYEGGITRVSRDTVMAYSSLTGVPVWWIEADPRFEVDLRSRCSSTVPVALPGQLSLSVAA